MDLLIGLLTIILVLNCVFLVLLILVQLPKKDAGAGLAFGGGATDALFGSGTGTVLTRATRYGATVFLLLSMGLSVMQSYQARASRQSILGELETRAATAPATTPTPTIPAGTPAAADTSLLPEGVLELPLPITTEPEASLPAETAPVSPADPAPGDSP